MPTPIAMPKLGMTMEQGTVVAWQVGVGARVEKGATVAVIESEKAEVELEATAAGWLRRTYVEPGRAVPCGTLLGALTDTPDEPFDAEAFRAQHDRPQPLRPSAAATATAAPPHAAAAAPAAARAPIAPAARARARELGIDAERVPGTGPGGRVTRQDVEAYARARESLVEVGGGVRLDVPHQGQGDAVLLLPGFGTDASAFARQVPALTASYAVLGVNPRGVGLSDAPEVDCYEVGQTAADAAAVAGGGAPVHVVGTSLGAAAAIELALAHPRRVRSLALIAPLVRASARLLAVIDAWVRLAAQLASEELARALLPWLFSERLLSDDAARERIARGLAQTLARVPAATLPRAAAGLRAWSGTRAADLGKIAAPVLVIAASADLLTPDGESIAATIPGARCLRIPDAGHAVALEAPDAVNAALLEHLQAAP